MDKLIKLIVSVSRRALRLSVSNAETFLTQRRKARRDAEKIGNQKSQITNPWKGSLTGKAVVLKTTGSFPCRFDSCPLRQKFRNWNFEISKFCLGRRCLTVWQRFAKSPRKCVCRFDSCRLRHKKLELGIWNFEIENSNFEIFGPVAQWN